MLNSETLDQLTDRDLSRLKMMLNYLADTKKEEVITLRVFTDEYENFVKVNLSDSYAKSVKISCNYLKEYFSAQKILSQLNLRDAEQFMIWLQSKTGNGYRVYYRNIKAALNKAVDWEYIKFNPFKKIKLAKKQRVNPAYISSDQLLVICDWLKNEVVKDVVNTAFYTGMRLNELVNLSWKNVDLAERIITVGDEEFTTKSRGQRYIPMSGEVYEILVRREKSKVKGESNIPRPANAGHPSNRGELNGEYVFCKGNGKPFTGDYYSKNFKRACKTAGTDKAIHFHSLRHSFASNLVQKGVSLYVVKELLGHSSIATTEIYSHLNVDSLREAIKQLDTSTPLRAGVKSETKKNNNINIGV